MDTYKIEKIKANVTLAMIDGTRITGCMFLSTTSANTAGPQTVREILTEPTAFMPFTEDGAGFVLIGKRAIAALYADLKDEPTPEFSKRVKALLKVEGAGDVEGELIVPEGPASFRVSDYLNGKSKWFKVEMEGKVVIIGRKAIKEIRI